MGDATLIFGIALTLAAVVAYRQCKASWDVLATQFDVDQIAARRRERRSERKKQNKARSGKPSGRVGKELKSRKADLTAAASSIKPSA